MKRFKLWEILLLSLSGTLMIVGVFFLLAQDKVGQHIIKKDQVIVSKVKKEVLHQNLEAPVSFNGHNVQALPLSELLLSQTNPETYPTIGWLSLPDVNIMLPVFKGLESAPLMIGAGTVKEEQVMGKGNYGLASHSIFDFYGNPLQDVLFDNLRNVERGQRIYLTDKDKVYVYQVEKKYETGPKDVFSDTPGKKEITLMTCVAQNSPVRLIVQGELLEAGKYEDFRSLFE